MTTSLETIRLKIEAGFIRLESDTAWEIIWYIDREYGRPNSIEFKMLYPYVDVAELEHTDACMIKDAIVKLLDCNFDGSHDEMKPLFDAIEAHQANAEKVQEMWMGMADAEKNGRLVELYRTRIEETLDVAEGVLRGRDLSKLNHMRMKLVEEITGAYLMNEN